MNTHDRVVHIETMLYQLMTYIGADPRANDHEPGELVSILEEIISEKTAAVPAKKQ